MAALQWTFTKLAMHPDSIFSLIFLILLFGAQLIWRPSLFLSKARFLFLFSILAVFIILAVYSILQFLLWQGDEISKFLLPPYQSINYFLSYAGIRFFLSYAISLFVAILGLGIGNWLNNRYGKRFFESNELYLFAAALFLTGHPGWFYYLLGLLLVYLLMHLISLFVLLILRVNLRLLPRFSVYYLWIAVAILVILV